MQQLELIPEKIDSINLANLLGVTHKHLMSKIKLLASFNNDRSISLKKNNGKTYAILPKGTALILITKMKQTKPVQNAQKALQNKEYSYNPSKETKISDKKDDMTIDYLKTHKEIDSYTLASALNLKHKSLMERIRRMVKKYNVTLKKEHNKTYAVMDHAAALALVKSSAKTEHTKKLLAAFNSVLNEQACHMTPFGVKTESKEQSKQTVSQKSSTNASVSTSKQKEIKTDAKTDVKTNSTTTSKTNERKNRIMTAAERIANYVQDRQIEDIVSLGYKVMNSSYFKSVKFEEDIEHFLNGKMFKSHILASEPSRCKYDSASDARSWLRWNCLLSFIDWLGETPEINGGYFGIFWKDNNLFIPRSTLAAILFKASDDNIETFRKVVGPKNLKTLCQKADNVNDRIISLTDAAEIINECWKNAELLPDLWYTRMRTSRWTDAETLTIFALAKICY